MATARPQNPLDSQGARTPMNGEPRTDLIELIIRTGSLSGDEDLASARPTLIRRHWATDRYLSSIRQRSTPELNQLALAGTIQTHSPSRVIMAEKEEAWETRVARKTRKKASNSS